MTDETTIAAKAAREEQERNEKRRRGWGCVVYAMISILAPALTLGLGWTILSIADGQLAAEAMQRARDAGDPLTATEMYAFYGSTPESEAATAKWIAALRAMDVIGQGTVSRNVPILGAGSSAPTLDERGLYDAATLARAEPFLATHGAEALNRAHAARDCAAEVRYPIPFEEGYDARTEYVQQLRTLANLLALQAQVRAAKGDLTGAAESMLTLIAVSETLAEAPEIIAYLVRIAILHVAADLAMKLIDRAEFPPEDLLRLQDAFARQNFHRQMMRAAQGEQFQALQFYSSSEPSDRGPDDRLRWMPFRGGDQALTLDLRREFLAAGEEGYVEADKVASGLDARISEIGTGDVFEQTRFAVTLELAPAFVAVVNASLRGEAQARMCAACCACERYRQERGEWPPTLESLVPEYLAEVPLDPVDDRALRYEVDGEKAIIHSAAHFRPENRVVDWTLGNGIASYVLGEKYEPEAPAAPAPNGIE